LPFDDHNLELLITWNFCKPLQCRFAQLFCAAHLRTEESQLFVKQGRLEPVETRVKNNKRGLGSKEPKARPKSKEEEVEKDPKKPKVSRVCESCNVSILCIVVSHFLYIFI
jgi:hypothetical protein